MNELKPCPFCGGEPTVTYIGNEHTKIRFIKIQCSGCRFERTDSALKFGFEWLDGIASAAWNRRIA